jgi:hypothetical protein
MRKFVLQYLFFRQEDYSRPRSTFVLTYGGMTVYCMETDRIYRPHRYSQDPNSFPSGEGKEYLTPTITIRQEKLLIFASVDPHTLAGNIEETIAKQNQKSGSPTQWIKAAQALHRWKIFKAQSLTWPISVSIDYTAITAVIAQGARAETRRFTSFGSAHEKPRSPPDQKLARDLYLKFNCPETWRKRQETLNTTGVIPEESSPSEEKPIQAPVRPNMVNIAQPGEQPRYVRGFSRPVGTPYAN